MVLPLYRALCFCLFFEETNHLSRDAVDILQVPAEISTLSEGLHALGARKWALACMFAKVIPQITALFENGSTVGITTLKIKFDPHRFRVPHLDGLMPRSGNTLKGLGLQSGRAT